MRPRLAAGECVGYLILCPCCNPFPGLPATVGLCQLLDRLSGEGFRGLGAAEPVLLEEVGAATAADRPPRSLARSNTQQWGQRGESGRRTSS